MRNATAIWIANMKSRDSPGFDAQLANLGLLFYMQILIIMVLKFILLNYNLRWKNKCVG